ncbi:potassium channel family protein [Segnochrobactrum spirostomi]|uniref:Two pore domain potassium channel family protein n=1 Tax=Segnochrobactrum spirostomi TaxID=2608987 RepID=A0A6A7XZW1_9HYPH|nr:potassium channel family protein [Segnochrobactrum spirostomi]MQT11112.1 two pore domain potassium channel family protein [Segnochrobactrum spirostomi]
MIPILLAALVVVASIIVHLGAMFLLVELDHKIPPITLRNHRWRLLLSMPLVTLLMIFAHLIEVALWAGIYVWEGTIVKPHDAFYFAFVNYTTLGYGDILPATHSRLMAPITAADGILMFGWTTAILIQTVSLHLRYEEHRHRQ